MTRPLRLALPLLLLSAATAAAQARSVEIDGHPLAYEESGEGYPLVLVNGGGMDLRQWDAQAEALSPWFRVIRYDPRGWGRSPAPARPYSQVEDLRVLLDSLGVSRAYLVGLSFGGGVALDFALEHPERVAALGLIAPAVGGFPWSEAFRERDRRFAAADDTTRVRLLLADPHFAPTSFLDRRVRGRVEELLRDNAGIFSIDPTLARPPERPAMRRLEELAVPTLLVTPGLDHPDLHAVADSLAARIPGVRRVTLPESGHMANLERPDALSELLLEFLGELERYDSQVTLEGDFAGSLAVEGGSIYYEVAGAGPPVVLVHGGLGDMRMWEEQMDALLREFRVALYDHRGFGRSPPPDSAYSPRADLLRLLDHLGIERAHLVGNSLGGSLALEFTLEHPERVASLTMVSAGAHGYPIPREDEERFEAMLATLERDGLPALLESWLAHPMLDAAREDPGVWERVRTLVTENGAVWRMEAWPVDPLDPPAATRLGEVSVPTLVVYGARDTPLVRAMADATARGIPGALKSVVPDADHLVQMERPREFNRLLVRFLRRAERAREP